MLPSRRRAIARRGRRSTTRPAKRGRSARPPVPTATITAPAGLPSGANSFIAVNVAAESPEHAAWRKPVQVYFRRTASGWQLVGLERQPDVDHAIPR